VTTPALLWAIFWVAFTVVSVADYYVVTHRRSPIGVRSALRWTGLWIGVALAFGAATYVLHPRGPEIAMDYVAGYLTEYSLSVDNLFVFILIFSLMGVEEVAQPKLIKLGIYLSIALRILFILFGIALIDRFHWLIYVFGALLVWTAWKMLTADEDEQVRPERNLLYRLVAMVLPVHAEEQSTKRLVTRRHGRLGITALFLVFVVIGSTDVLFAVDSIPAIMGISQDPFVVLTSNVFAVLGLNSLFFALRGIMSLFRFLKHGVSVILFFIGGKMMLPGLGELLRQAGLRNAGDALVGSERFFKDHSWFSLAVIVLVLAVSIILSSWHEKLSAGRPPGPDVR
jgi:tellurite resistance protein TerC